MQREFEQYLKNACHCSPDRRILLAVSGGIDSVLMVHLFHRAGMDCSMAHCNFQLRGEESDGDQQFVEELAVKMNIPCWVTSFETARYASGHGVSIQMAARVLRYEWFAALKEKHGYDYIAVGHNQNDVVETFLLNFTRGTGIRGLSGIRARQGSIIRPLLFTTREAIHEYAENQKIAWREDSSNKETKYLRNHIRHVLIPGFKALNPAFIQNAMETINRLSQTELLFEMTVAHVKKAACIELPDKYMIDIEKLKEYPAIETLLFELLKDFGCTQLNINSLISSFDASPGKRFYTRTHCITRDRTHLIITKISPSLETTLFIEHGTIHVSFPVHLTFKWMDHVPSSEIPSQVNFAMLDADKVVFPILLRKWKQGDSFKPLGMKGTKKVSDFLINNKIPLPDKQHIWVLESGGNIIWLVNHRIDDRVKITPQTKQILLIEYTGIHED